MSNGRVILAVHVALVISLLFLGCGRRGDPLPQPLLASPVALIETGENPLEDGKNHWQVGDSLAGSNVLSSLK